jgi:hypothetical protein
MWLFAYALVTWQKSLANQKISRFTSKPLGRATATYPQNTTRVVLIVCNTAITEPAVGHDGVEARVGHGNATTGRRRLGAVDEGIDGGIAAMFLLNFSIPSAPHSEKGSSQKTSQDDNTNNGAGSNTSNVGLLSSRWSI